MTLKQTIKTSVSDVYRCINEFKKAYEPRSHSVKDKKGDLLSDFHSILKRCKNYFCQLINVHGVNAVRQTEMHAPEPSSSEVELAIENMKSKILRY
jgi:hypothetical protein